MSRRKAKNKTKVKLKVKPEVKKKKPPVKSVLVTPACPYFHDLKLNPRSMSSVDTKFGSESLRFCKECNCYYTNNKELGQYGKKYMGEPIRYSDQRLVRKTVNRIVVSYEIKSLNKNTEQNPLNLTIASRHQALLIYANKCTCRYCYNRNRTDTVVDKMAYVTTKDGRDVAVNVQFCTWCERYFMNYESFKSYQKMYGTLDIEFEFDSSIPDTDELEDFAENSVLSRHGYSVKAGIHRTTRQQALSRILNDGIATKHEIIKLLTQFIKINKNRFPDACRRWEDDILFVNQYRIDEQDNAGLLKMKQGGKIRRPDD